MNLPTKPESCRRCGDAHDLVACPYVKAVDFDDLTGAIVRVEFLVPSDYAKMPMPPVHPSAAADGDEYPRLGSKA